MGIYIYIYISKKYGVLGEKIEAEGGLLNVNVDLMGNRVKD